MKTNLGTQWKTVLQVSSELGNTNGYAGANEKLVLAACTAFKVPDDIMQEAKVELGKWISKKVIKTADE